MKLFQWTLPILIGVLLFPSDLQAELRPQVDQEGWTLWPGESYIYHDVQVTWEVPEKTADLEKDIGHLQFKGPRNRLKNVQLPISINEHQMTRSKDRVVYIDNAIFNIRYNQTGTFPPSLLLSRGIIFTGQYQKNQLNVGGALEALSFWVSHICPVELNDWKLTISEKPVTYPGENEFYQLLAENNRTHEKLEFPAIEGSSRKFGRYSVRISGFDEVTQTAWIKTEADVDLSIRGRYAYIETLKDLNNQSYGEIIDALGTKYGFQVEWVESSGAPESIQAAKKFSLPPRAYRLQGRQSRSVDDLIQRLIASQDMDSVYRLEWEWKDNTHLKVWAKNYDAYLEYVKEEDERQEKKAQVNREFDTNYKLITRIYTPKTISIESARGMISKLLDTYYLASTEIYSRENAIRRWPPKEPGGLPNYQFNGSITESIVADPKSESLIVAAIPETHKKVEELLARTEAMVKEDRPAGPPPKRFQVEIALLKGGSEQDRILISSEFDGTLLKVADARSQVKEGEIIATVHSTDLLLEKKKLEATIEHVKYQIQANDQLYKSLKASQEAGRISTQDEEYVRLQTKQSELEFQQQLLHLESEALDERIDKGNIKAPVSGTVSMVYNKPPSDIKENGFILSLIPDENQKATSEEDLKLAASYGFTPEDLEKFGLKQVSQLGKGLVNLSAERGSLGKALVSLSKEYQCEVEFQDIREPYLIVKGKLMESNMGKVLLENTLFLEKDKPAVLGLTNLKDALILVARLKDEL